MDLKITLMQSHFTDSFFMPHTLVKQPNKVMKPWPLAEYIKKPEKIRKISYNPTNKTGIAAKDNALQMSTTIKRIMRQVENEPKRRPNDRHSAQKSLRQAQRIRKSEKKLC